MFSKGVEVSTRSFMWSDLKNSIDMSIGYYGYSKEISFIFPEKDFKLNADKDLLEMLFSNFMANAIDAIECDDNEEGSIEVVYENDGFYHKFYIYDSGVEIENKKELFEAFKSTKVKGNGLGLVLCREIAEAHGGSVELLDTDKKCFEIKIAI
jgi:two-component system NtrC family sensor kinase/two-component system sensor histidine kinase AtoS